MASETSIANAALSLLGERRIDSLDDGTPTANVLKERYPEIRDATLRAHPWNFATKRISLAADATTPDWKYDRQFTLPTDLLRLLLVNNPEKIPYEVEGRTIVTDLGAPLEIQYTAQITDANQMDVLFREALSAALAADVAEAITGSTSKVEAMLAIRDQKIRAARTPDAQEPTPPMFDDGDWLDAREEAGPGLQIPSGTGFPL